MNRRYVAVWLSHLATDHRIILQPELADTAFVLAAPERGRMVIKAADRNAEKQGLETGMAVADARAVFPSLMVLDEKPELARKTLDELAEWCIRFTPIVATDPPDGLVLDSTGCTHLWGGEHAYLKDLLAKLRSKGYATRAAMADTIATAWAVARYSPAASLIPAGGQAAVLAALPPAALRLEAGISERMQKLGFYRIGRFMEMPRSVLRRRFGQDLLVRLDQALGHTGEIIEPIRPAAPYQERLPSLEPIRTAAAIEFGLRKLLEALCQRLAKENKGLRKALLTCYRIDGEIQQIEIGTSSPSSSVEHLFRLFQLKIASIRPALGIDLFELDAPVVEDTDPFQETLWNISGSNDQAAIAELLDRLTARGGRDIVRRYLPQEHYWPERSIKKVSSLTEKPQTAWRTDRPRPVNLLPHPELIQVTAPIPDYPPMQFRYRDKVHKIRKADGPERIEQEWWIAHGLHRDYYCVEDEDGARYWIFRLGPYDENTPEWFIHGFFA